ncbi:hypothetical protein L195_g041978 [Trifolium pratense]|uniref:Uncharacterized protein n=1 Tax=Trifolium pratense TaxID=57577 RepID=A0A2K3M554_TRIPR|nr:hypothetical protein L195_g041978 [Trifolium pratense]
MLILILTLPLRTKVSLKLLKETIPEKDAAHDATTSVAQENLDYIVIPESPDNVIVPDKENGSEATATDNVFVHDTYVIPRADDSGKTMFVPLNVDEFAEKDSNVIDVDNLNSRESPAESKKKSLTRKEISSSVLDFDEEQHVIASSGTS